MNFLLIFLWFAADSPTQLLQQGLLALQHGDLKQARTDLESATKADPKNAYAWVSLAETYARLKLSVPGNSAAERAEKFGGEDPRIQHALAMYYSHTGEYGRAAKLEQEFARSDKADGGAMARAAELYLNAGDAGAALPLLASLPSSPKVEDSLGRALIAEGKLQEGVRHLAAAWDGAVGDERIGFDYAQGLLQAQNFAGAAVVANQVLAGHANDGQLMLVLGVARYGQRRFEDAVTAFLRVIQMDGSIEQPYLFLGKMLDQAGGHLAEIIAVYEKRAREKPRDAGALMLLAEARMASDSKDPTAEPLLRRSLSIDGRNWEAHYQLGVLLAEKKDWRGAAAELKRSEELDPKQPMPHYHLARVYDRLGETEKAKAERAEHERLGGA